MAPTSQKAGVRPISFLLSGIGGALTSVSLNVRPEDLTRVDPSRLTVQQTLGGAWVDNFGTGLSTISISGHTGWRGGTAGDGVTQFAALRDTVFTQWHAQRAAAIANGQDPNQITLTYADALDSMTCVVAPGQFVLKRSRTRPLLMMYQINMTVISDGAPPAVTSSLSYADTVTAAIISLSASIAKMETFIATANLIINAAFLNPGLELLNLIAPGLSTVLSLVQSADGIIPTQTGQLIGVMADLCLAGRNAFYNYNAIAMAEDDLSFEIAAIANEFDNAFCVLSNAFPSQSSYPDYTGLYGASGCSSTSGGSPLSAFLNSNTFDQLTPQFASLVAVTAVAQGNIGILTTTDPVLAPLALNDLVSRVLSICSGVTLP